MTTVRTDDSKRGRKFGFALGEIGKENLPGVTALAKEQKIPGARSKGAHTGAFLSGQKVGKSLSFNRPSVRFNSPPATSPIVGRALFI
jgi:hypothetical protein